MLDPKRASRRARAHLQKLQHALLVDKKAPQRARANRLAAALTVQVPDVKCEFVLREQGLVRMAERGVGVPNVIGLGTHAVNLDDLKIFAALELVQALEAHIKSPK